MRPEEEDLAGALLPDHPREVGAAVAAVEAADVGIRLLERGVLAGGDREVADDVQAVAAAGRPAVDHGDDDLGHGADEALHLEDVQAPALGPDPALVDGVGGGALGVLVAGAATDALVAAGAEGPLAVAARALGAGAVAGEQHDADVGGAAGVVEHPVELVDGVRPEGVEHLGPVEGDAHAAQADGPVVGDVGEVLEAGHLLPGVGVEGLADTGDRAHGGKASPWRGCGQPGGGVGGSCHARREGGPGGSPNRGSGWMRVARS